MRQQRAGALGCAAGQQIDRAPQERRAIAIGAGGEVAVGEPEQIAALSRPLLMGTSHRKAPVKNVVASIRAGLAERFRRTPAVADELPALVDAVRSGRIAPTTAAQDLLDRFIVSAGPDQG